MNLSLLLKWRWRILNVEERSLWNDVLVAKYGSLILNNVRWPTGVFPYYSSLWWKDIGALEVCVENRNWLEEVFVRKIGNGNSTRFWKDCWFADSPFCSKFPRLFSLSVHKEAFVSEVVEVVEGRCRWSLLWRRELYLWEVEWVTHLLGPLENLVLSFDVDRWKWKPNEEDGFSVKTAFDSLMEFHIENHCSNFELKIFASIWDSPAPPR
ncbi:hypothetical protein QL285_000827 [Trifolium repens]|nr:hypothetical protein QL285_000827 [Trifolium repens]